MVSMSVSGSRCTIHPVQSADFCSSSSSLVASRRRRGSGEGSTRVRDLGTGRVRRRRGNRDRRAATGNWTTEGSISSRRVREQRARRAPDLFRVSANTRRVVFVTTRDTPIQGALPDGVVQIRGVLCFDADRWISQLHYRLSWPILIKLFARATRFPLTVKYIDTRVRYAFLISWHGFGNDVTKYVDACVCDTIANDSGVGPSSSIRETRAQPYISVLSNSNSMHFVIHAVVQSCAAGARTQFAGYADDHGRHTEVAGSLLRDRLLLRARIHYQKKTCCGLWLRERHDCVS